MKEIVFVRKSTIGLFTDKVPMMDILVHPLLPRFDWQKRVTIFLNRYRTNTEK